MFDEQKNDFLIEMDTMDDKFNFNHLWNWPKKLILLVFIFITAFKLIFVYLKRIKAFIEDWALSIHMKSRTLTMPIPTLYSGRVTTKRSQSGY